MVIIGKVKVQKFISKHGDSLASLRGWIEATELANWTQLKDVHDTFCKAKLLKNNRARFQIAGNKYRLIIEVDFVDEEVEIRFIGTHSEYDKVVAESV